MYTTSKSTFVVVFAAGMLFATSYGYMTNPYAIWAASAVGAYLAVMCEFILRSRVLLKAGCWMQGFGYGLVAAGMCWFSFFIVQ